MAKLSALGYLGIAKEVTFGTSVAPVVFIPYDSIKNEDEIGKSIDEGRRGVMTKEFAAWQTTRKSKVEIESLAYPDTLGYFLLGVLGKDTVTGSAAPYSHKFQVLDGNANSFTLSDYNVVAGTNERRYPGAILDEVGIKFDDVGNMKVSAKFQSKISTLTAKSTPTQNVLKPFAGWMATLTLGGSVNADLLGGDVTIKRANQLIYGGQATQDPTKYITGRIEMSGKLTFDIDDESEWLNFSNGTQPSLSITFNVDANTSLTIQCSKVDFSKATIDRSNEFVRLDVDFKALYNTVDAGLATITLKNAVASY
jgi:hypothetical protein